VRSLSFFIQQCRFKTKNDRLLIGVLKDLGFIDSDGKPQPRYYEYLDRTRAKQVLAEAIREAYADLFAISKNAYELDASEIKNKLRTLYTGQKSDHVIDLIAKTFESLVLIADFSVDGPRSPREESVNGREKFKQ
jgi:hypothetical protein